MIKATLYSKTKSIIIGLIVNFLLSWTILPLAIPPFHIYTFRELMEVLLWQGMGAVGWPFAILGGFASLILQGKVSDLAALILVLIYPTMLFLLIYILFAKRSKQWVLIVLHMLIAFSFVVIWYQVLNGYDFMIG
ncbi:MAG: hypothetical protein IT308_02740 [Anaerolineaceae bacterium]|nr:hypothetical protein [Anaerolineaceae bacterium]